jgi:uncharacterized membrane protein YkoI
MTLRKRALLVLTLVGAITLGGVAFRTTFYDASAGQSGVLDDGKELLPQAGIGLTEAIAAAQTAYNGDIGEVDLEYWQGVLVFNVDVGDQDVKVDARSGAVLGATKDD